MVVEDGRLFVEADDGGVGECFVRAPDALHVGVMNLELASAREKGLTRGLVRCRPVAIRARFVVADDHRDVERAHLVEERPGTERVEERREGGPIDVAQQLEAAHFLATDLEDVADDGDADHTVLTRPR